MLIWLVLGRQYGVWYLLGKISVSTYALTTNAAFYTFRIFLKEKLILFDICNIFITLVGILFIIRWLTWNHSNWNYIHDFSRPPFIFGYDPNFTIDGEYYIAGGIVFAGSVLFQSNVYIMLRMLKSIHFSVTLLVFGIIGAMESAGINYWKTSTAKCLGLRKLYMLRCLMLIWLIYKLN